MNAIEKLRDATRMLSEVRSASDAKRLVDIAAAAEYYATKAKLGGEAISYAHTIRIDAMRLLGGYLAAEGALATGGQPYQDPTGNSLLPVGLTPTLEVLGLSKRESSAAQFLHRIAPEEVAPIRAGEKSITAVRRELQRAEVIEAIQLPSATYRVFYADPPWKYGDQLTESYGATKYHYPAMSIAELCNLPIKEMAEWDAVLFLWVTSPLLDEVWPLITAWGFEYKTSFVWDKVKHNMGHYNSVRHELLLVCTRGSCLPDSPKLIDSVQSIERSGHSEKPEEFRTIIDTLYTRGKRIELFARRDADGWDRWGNAANSK
jgi:N6-adenosine-specific RNA methylase IME4